MLVASAMGLAATLLIVRPAPASGLWLFGVLLEGYSLVVAGAAALGVMVTAGVLIGTGAAVLGGLAVGFGVAAFGIALVPVVQGRRAARTHRRGTVPSALLGPADLEPDGQPTRGSCSPTRPICLAAWPWTCVGPPPAEHGTELAGD